MKTQSNIVTRRRYKAVKSPQNTAVQLVGQNTPKRGWPNCFRTVADLDQNGGRFASESRPIWVRICRRFKILQTYVRNPVPETLEGLWRNGKY
ncbi:MAG: hypothetical protein Q8O90_06315, partial [Elusimicrobiota bacterium]|nr:hypothetical protein [Elusimicrobiota bacterium]